MAEQKSKPTSDDQLSESLQQTFPASDAITPSKPEMVPTRPLERQTPHIDKNAVDQLAKRVPQSK